MTSSTRSGGRATHGQGLRQSCRFLPRLRCARLIRIPRRFIVLPVAARFAVFLESSHEIPEIPVLSHSLCATVAHAQGNQPHTPRAHKPYLTTARNRWRSPHAASRSRSKARKSKNASVRCRFAIPTSVAERREAVPSARAGSAAPGTPSLRWMPGKSRTAAGCSPGVVLAYRLIRANAENARKKTPGRLIPQ